MLSNKVLFSYFFTDGYSEELNTEPIIHKMISTKRLISDQVESNFDIGAFSLYEDYVNVIELITGIPYNSINKNNINLCSECIQNVVLDIGFINRLIDLSLDDEKINKKDKEEKKRYESKTLLKALFLLLYPEFKEVISEFKVNEKKYKDKSFPVTNLILLDDKAKTLSGMKTVILDLVGIEIGGSGPFDSLELQSCVLDVEAWQLDILKSFNKKTFESDVVNSEKFLGKLRASFTDELTFNYIYQMMVNSLNWNNQLYISISSLRK